MAERRQFEDGVDATLEEWFDALLRTDATIGERIDEERTEGYSRVVGIVRRCRDGEYGPEAKRLIGQLCVQARDFVAVNKGTHDISKPDPRIRPVSDMVILKAWGSMQMTMTALEQCGVDWGPVPEPDVAAALMSTSC